MTYQQFMPIRSLDDITTPFVRLDISSCNVAFQLAHGHIDLLKMLVMSFSFFLVHS